MIPLLGLQNDEALFGHALYEPRAGLYMLKLPHARLPLMLMSYLGTLKSLICRQVFRVFRPNLYSIRVPMLLAGAVTLWLFYKLLRRIAGNRAALVGTSLLATDATYLLTSCFDWGPVALQHLLLVGGLLLVLQFYQEASHRALFWAFFLLGLGMWDKALMVWMLGGLGVATLVVFPRQIFGCMTWRRLGLATGAFVLGALPLIIYNIQNHWDTFRGNSTRDFSDLAGKGRLLAGSLTGDALFGWMVAEDSQVASHHAPEYALDTVAFGLSKWAGEPRRSLMLAALALALLLAPLARGWDLRALLFTAVAAVVAWLLMATTKNAGGSVHHTVLLWPLPQMFVAVSFTAAARRLRRYAVPSMALVMVVLLAANVLVVNQYYVQAVRNGGAQNWNDAITPLAEYFRATPSKFVFCIDWGILDSLRLLNRGRTALAVGSDPVSKHELDRDDMAMIRSQVGDPAHLFVTHTEGNEFFPGTDKKLAKIAGEMGFERENMAVISDSFGKPFFQVFHFRARAQ